MSVSNEPLELGMENFLPTYHASVNTEYDKRTGRVWETKLLGLQIDSNWKNMQCITMLCCEVGHIGYEKKKKKQFHFCPFHQDIGASHRGKSIEHLNTF